VRAFPVVFIFELFQKEVMFVSKFTIAATVYPRLSYLAVYFFAFMNGILYTVP